MAWSPLYFKASDYRVTWAVSISMHGRAGLAVELMSVSLQRFLFINFALFLTTGIAFLSSAGRRRSPVDKADKCLFRL